MAKKKRKFHTKEVPDINPQINSKSDTPSMGSWPISPAPVLDSPDYKEKSDKEI